MFVRGHQCLATPFYVPLGRGGWVGGDELRCRRCFLLARYDGLCFRFDALCFRLPCSLSEAPWLVGMSVWWLGWYCFFVWGGYLNGRIFGVGPLGPFVYGEPLYLRR